MITRSWFERRTGRMKHAAFAAAFLLAARSQAQSQQVTIDICQPADDLSGGPDDPDGTLSNYAPPGSQPADCFFCGNVRKFLANGQPAYNVGSYSPSILEPNPNGPIPLCKNVPDGQGDGTFALERAEIRGWIVHIDSYKDGEDEFNLDVLLDVGWIPTLNSANKTVPINTPSSIAVNGITPVNPIIMGKAQNVTPPPYDHVPFDSLGDAEIGASTFFGGAYGPVVHLEIDGWGGYWSDRNGGYDCGYCSSGGDVNPTAGQTPHCMSRGWCDATAPSGCSPSWVDDNAPLGWSKVTLNDVWTPALYGSAFGACSPDFATYWPFPVMTDARADTSFHVGQYVRAVGTIWRDGVHGGAGHTPDEEDASACWGTEFPAIGWAEMHPVDFLTPVTDAQRAAAADPRYINYTIAQYSMCGYAGYPDQINGTGSFSIGPRPSPDAKAYFFSNIVVPPWNAVASLSLVGPDQSGNYSALYQGTGFRSNSNAAYQSGIYSAYWCVPNCSGMCGGESDGCGGQCPTVSCSNGYVCSAGNCVWQCNSTTCAGGCCSGNIYDPASCQTPSTSNGCITGGGACGNQCTAGWVCANGACAYQCNGTTCPNGCCNGGTCTASAPSNGCVSGGNYCAGSCPTNAVCSGGACACPADHPASCPGACVDLSSDNNNCGACGNACIPGYHQACEGGVCTCTNGPPANGCPRNEYWDDFACTCSF